MHVPFVVLVSIWIYLAFLHVSSVRLVSQVRVALLVSVFVAAVPLHIMQVLVLFAEHVQLVRRDLRLALVHLCAISVQ